MKIAAKATILSLLLAAPLPALAEVPVPEVPPAEEGTSLMEEGLKMMMRGMMTELEPALEDMQGMLGELGDVTDQLGPQIQSILTLMGDVRFYDMPERLPNGDILIRRKADAPPPPPLGVPEAAPAPAPEIEL